MLKSFFSLCLCLAMLSTCPSEVVNNIVDDTNQRTLYHDIIPYDDLMEYATTDDVIVEITNTDEYSVSEIENFLLAGGIILQRCENEENNALLNLPFEVSETIADEEDIECVASIYYGVAGQIGVKDIIVESNDSKVIEESITNGLIAVEKRQKDASIQNYSVDAETEYATEYIGEYSYLYTYIPYFELDVLYEVYTVQDLQSGKDYYTVMGYVFGNPGCVMNSVDEDYEKKYQCDYLGVTFEATTTGLTRKDYSPVRTIDTDTYNVDIGLSLEKENIGISASLFSASYSIPDTDIEVTSTTKVTDWVVSYADFKDSQKKTSEFHPAIIWECPSSFNSAEFSITTSYQVDSWNTFPVSRSFTANITCYPDRITWERA